MRIVSWNVSGLLPRIKNHGFAEIEALCPDIICCQEIRTNQRPQVLSGYEHYWQPSRSGGFSGTLIMTRQSPRRVINGFAMSPADTDGRVLTAEYPGFIVVNLNVPKSARALRRGRYNFDWEDEMLQHLYDERSKQPLIVCGDFNAPQLPIDASPEILRGPGAQLGPLAADQVSLETVLGVGLVDAYRRLYGGQTGAWTCREGRHDYFFVDEDLAHRIKAVRHHMEIIGSDHCPIELELDLCDMIPKK